MTTKHKIAVLISSNHPIFLEGMKVALRSHLEIKVVGETRLLADTVGSAIRLHPDVVLLDIPAGDYAAVEAIRRMREVDPRLKIFALSLCGEPETYHHAGLTGFIAPDTTLDQLIHKIVAAARRPPGKGQRSRTGKKGRKGYMSIDFERRTR